MPSEESSQEQAARYIGEARDVIRGLLRVEPDGMERHVIEAITKVANAVDVLVSPDFSLDLSGFRDLDEYGPGQLEALRDSLFGPRDDPDTPLADTKFVVSFPDVELTVDEVWPPINGEAPPEHPTPQDVVEEMKNYTKYSSPGMVAIEWLLLERLSVRDANDATGDGQVEWDGT